MSGQLVSFLVQIAPIAAGAAFVFVLKGVKFPEPGIQVRFSGGTPREPADAEAEAGGAPSQRSESAQEETDLHRREFERLVYDELITNGIFDPHPGVVKTNRLAFEELGLLDARKAGHLKGYLSGMKRDRLRLFAQGGRALHRWVLPYSGEYGLLLAYLLARNLEIIGS